MVSYFKDVFRVFLITCGLCLAASLWRLSSSTLEVADLSKRVADLESGRSQFELRFQAVESSVRLNGQPVVTRVAVHEESVPVKESVGSDMKHAVPEKVVANSAVASGSTNKLHSMVIRKKIMFEDSHEKVCQQALNPKGRETDPFGVPLWRRVLLEHNSSPFHDCRSGQKSSGCSAFTGQGFQDLFLYTAIWRHYNRTGVYLDLASNDYFYISNTFFADHCLKFDGICIEANPQYHQNLRERRRCVLEEICVAETMKPVEFDFRGVFGGIVGAKIDGKGGKGEVKKMICQPLSAIFRKYDVHHVDYMNLDVEGVELQCLQGIDWDAVTIDVIGIEVNPNFQDLSNFLVSKGYIRTVTIAHDGMFVHNSATTVLQLVNAWQRDECPRLNDALRAYMPKGKNAIPRC